MKYIITTTLLIVTIVFAGSCKPEDLTQDEEAVKLQEQYEHVIELAQSVECTNQDNWAFTPIGVKACGGPTMYIAYSKTIDTILLFDKIDALNNFETSYNNKWNIGSDCETPETPTSVTCEEGMPVLVY